MSYSTPRLEGTTLLPEIRLRVSADRRLRAGHRWVYSNEIDVQDGTLKMLDSGASANLLNAGGDILGSAYFNSQALLCGRLYSRSKNIGFHEVLEERIVEALAWREQCYDQPFYRLIYGDGDGLPGIVVDRYGDFLVLQVTTAGAAQVLDQLVSALEKIVKPLGILLRNDAENVIEQLSAETRVLSGEVPTHVVLLENNVKFHVPLLEGQKTGWFYDHRESRQRLMQFVKGKRVLDVFSYAGAWGLQAMSAGASELVAIDRSQRALDLLTQSAMEGGFSEALTTIQENADQALKALASKGEKFDVVVVDPPAFIKRRKDQRNGEKTYHHINQLALKLLAPGGILVSASCSLHLSRDSLLKVVKTAAYKTGKQAYIFHQGGLGADHPTVATMPEMDYLKTIFARIS